MDFKKVLIAGAVIGAVWYFYNKSKKAKVAATPKAENSNMDAALMAKMGHSNATGGSKCRCRNALGGYTDVPCPCPAPQSIFK